jgi:hypothetical protein
MAIPHDSLQPAHDILRDIWHKVALEEERLQNLISNTPDPAFSGGQPDPVREDMIRTWEIVRAHRRYTRACVDVLGWGDPVDALALPADKARANRATEAAQTFAAAIVEAHKDLCSRLHSLRHEIKNEDDRGLVDEHIRTILLNFTYAFESARADLRKSL